jgi:hypothetical protein
MVHVILHRVQGDVRRWLVICVRVRTYVMYLL